MNSYAKKIDLVQVLISLKRSKNFFTHGTKKSKTSRKEEKNICLNQTRKNKIVTENIINNSREVMLLFR